MDDDIVWSTIVDKIFENRKGPNGDIQESEFFELKPPSILKKPQELAKIIIGLGNGGGGLLLVGFEDHTGQTYTLAENDFDTEKFKNACNLIKPTNTIDVQLHIVNYHGEKKVIIDVKPFQGLPFIINENGQIHCYIRKNDETKIANQDIVRRLQKMGKPELNYLDYLHSLFLESFRAIPDKWNPHEYRVRLPTGESIRGTSILILTGPNSGKNAVLIHGEKLSLPLRETVQRISEIVHASQEKYRKTKKVDRKGLQKVTSIKIRAGGFAFRNLNAVAHDMGPVPALNVGKDKNSNLDIYCYINPIDVGDDIDRAQSEEISIECYLDYNLDLLFNWYFTKATDQIFKATVNGDPELVITCCRQALLILGESIKEKIQDLNSDIGRNMIVKNDSVVACKSFNSIKTAELGGLLCKLACNVLYSLMGISDRTEEYEGRIEKWLAQNKDIKSDNIRILSSIYYSWKSPMGKMLMDIDSTLPKWFKVLADTFYNLISLKTELIKMKDINLKIAYANNIELPVSRLIYLELQNLIEENFSGAEIYSAFSATRKVANVIPFNPVIWVSDMCLIHIPKIELDPNFEPGQATRKLAKTIVSAILTDRHIIILYDYWSKYDIDALKNEINAIKNELIKSGEITAPSIQRIDRVKNNLKAWSEYLPIAARITDRDIEPVIKLFRRAARFRGMQFVKMIRAYYYREAWIENLSPLFVDACDYAADHLGEKKIIIEDKYNFAEKGKQFLTPRDPLNLKVRFNGKDYPIIEKIDNKFQMRGLEILIEMMKQMGLTDEEDLKAVLNNAKVIFQRPWLTPERASE
jgi:hypothetical protein